MINTECLSITADGITDPAWLAIQLYSREMIGSDLRTEAQKPEIEERVKIERLLSAVENQILVTLDWTVDWITGLD